MKALKPSHREKKRYLLVSGKGVSKKNIENAILEFIGVLGYAKTNPQIIKSNKNKIIFSINRENLNNVRASFVFSEKDINIIKVSGSVSKLKDLI